MNIMLFSRICARTGVGNHMKELAEELSRQEHNVVVVSGTNDININSDIPGGGIQFIEIHQPNLNPLTLIKDLRRLHQIIVEKKIDVVHCHHRMAALYMKAYTLLWKIPVVYTLHSANVPSDYIHRKMTYVGRCAIGVSTDVSSFMIEKLRIPKEKVVTVLNGVDDKRLVPLENWEMEEIRNCWNIDEDKFVVVMHGRIDVVKNHLLTVEAIHQLPPQVRNRVVVVFSGEMCGEYYQQVRDRVRSYNLDESFRFVGWVETRKILGIADCMVLPSFNEGFPLSVCEAFFMNVPVFRSKTGGFDDQKYCYPISYEKPDDLAQLITEFVFSPEAFSSQVKLAYDFARNNLTLKRMTENIVDIYRRVLTS